MKFSLNELKLEIAQILAEAKKKTTKEKKASAQAGKAAMAYGFYDEALDFSEPLGAANLYRQQGAVNWGPYTSAGPHVEDKFSDPHSIKESEDKAIRALVREVLELGIIPEGSAWQDLQNTLGESAGDDSKNVWEAAQHWFQKYGDEKKDEKPKKGKNFEQTKYKLDKKAQNAASPKK